MVERRAFWVRRMATVVFVRMSNDNWRGVTYFGHVLLRSRCRVASRGLWMPLCWSLGLGWVLDIPRNEIERPVVKPGHLCCRSSC